MEDPHLQLDALPDNCVHRVLSLLPLDSLCACAAVSRHLRSLVDDSLLWQDVDITASRVQCAAPIGDATLRCIALKVEILAESLSLPWDPTQAAAVLDGCKALRDFRFSVAASGLHPLLPLLLLPPCSLVGLRIAGPPSASAAASLLADSHRLGDFGARALAGPLRAAPAVRALVLDCNGIAEAGARAIAWALEGPSGGGDALAAPRALSLRSNALAVPGLRALLQPLSAGRLALSSLDVSGNQISDEGAELLAEALSAAPAAQALRTLALGNNRVSAAGAATLAAAVRASGCVEHLDLSGNALRADGAAAIARLLHAQRRRPAPTATGADGRRVVHLLLAGCELGPEGAEALARGIASARHLQTLHLQDNAIGDKGMKRIAVALLKHRGKPTERPDSPTGDADVDGEAEAGAGAPGSAGAGAGASATSAAAATAEPLVGGSLRSLHLDRNGLTSEACRALRAALRDGPFLDELSLCGNPLGPEGLATLRLALGGMASLRLAGVQAGPAGAAEVARGLRSSRCKLARLDLSSNAISREGAHALGDALPLCPTLRELELEANGLEEAGARELAGRAAAGGGCALEALGLKGNALGPLGAEALAASLAAAFGSLTSLNLHENGIEDVGCAAVAAYLSQTPCPRLEVLNLQYNHIRFAGAKALAAALAVNTRLQDLSLHNNSVRGESCGVLAEALLANRTLARLSLCYNNIRDNAYAFAPVLKRRGDAAALWELDLRSNDLGQSELQELQEAAGGVGGIRLRL